MTKYPNKIYWSQTKITLSRKDENGEELTVESNYRSRSLLFISLGCLLSNIDKLVVPENGTISINYPLTPSRVVSLSTRTTHPFVINSIQNLLIECNINIVIDNPYSTLTKGQMIVKCSNPIVLSSIYSQSVSCGKRGRRQNWQIKTGTDHCGVCMPCLYRRAALHKQGLDNQVYGNDILTATNLDEFVDMKALFNYLNKPLNESKIKRDLLVNGSINFDDLDNYANLVTNSRRELIQWLSEKGNDFIKKQLRIQ